MGNNLDYLLGQALSLVFYIITLVIYNQARKEYIGGKIGSAIKLVMGFLCIRLLADFVDYFSGMILPIKPDTVLILKIVLNLSAMCVLFFGGLRLFMTKPAAGVRTPKTGRPPKKTEPDVIKAKPSQDFDKGKSPISQDEIRDEPQKTPDDRPTLGRYEILGQIGRGAMGVIYKGRDSKLQRPTAIKTIRFGDDFNEDQVENIKKQFYREAEMVARLSHTNIVAIYDIGEDLDLSYLAMEYLDGESLAYYTHEENLLSVGECIQVMIQVCDALHYAHSQNIVHRDIKPANIMLLKNGVVKVTDFGIARLTNGSQTRTGVVKGTPYYMSPEQTKGEKVTGVSDIFSLGTVFYQLMTGKLPFTGETLTAIMYQTMNTDPVPAVEFNSGVDQETMAILDRALEKDRQKRYQTAGQMADDLRALSKHRGEHREPAVEGKNLTQTPYEDPDRERLRQKDSFVSEARVRTQTRPRKTEEEFHFPGKSGGEKKDGGLSRTGWFVRIAAALIILSSLCVPFFYSRVKNKGTALKKADPPSGLIKKKIQVTTSVEKPPVNEGSPAGSKEKNAEVPLAGGEEENRNDRERLAREKEEKRKADAREAEEKRKARERLIREAEEKKKNQERLIREAEEKKKQQEQLSLIAEKERKQKERFAIQEEQKRIERERRAEAERKRKALRASELKEIERMISRAKTDLANGDYAGAGDGYRNALSFISKSEFKNSEPHVKLKENIENALQNDSIVYGAKGYIYYKKKWLPPDEHKKQLLADGFVKYRDEFVLHQRFTAKVKALATREVQALLRENYSGKQTHKEQIDMKKMSLTKNTLLRSHYTVLFNWEVWTLNSIGNGACIVEVFYDVENDEWKTSKAKEK